MAHRCGTVSDQHGCWCEPSWQLWQNANTCCCCRQLPGHDQSTHWLWGYILTVCILMTVGGILQLNLTGLADIEERFFSLLQGQTSLYILHLDSAVFVALFQGSKVCYPFTKILISEVKVTPHDQSCKQNMGQLTVLCVSAATFYHIWNLKKFNVLQCQWESFSNTTLLYWCWVKISMCDLMTLFTVMFALHQFLFPLHPCSLFSLLVLVICKVKN